MGEMDEGSMADAEHHPDGPHFGGYWKGTDPNPPKPGMGVGGMEESGVEANYVQGAGVDDSQSPIHTRRLSVDEEWDAFMNEIAGANNPAQGTSSTGTNSIDAAKTAKEISNAQQSLNKFKAAGTNLPVSVGQAAKSAVATASNPTAATTGQGLDSNAKKTTMGLGQQIEKLLATGNQGQVQQVANAIKQSNMGQK